MKEKHNPPKSKELKEYMKDFNINDDIFELFTSSDYFYEYTSHTAALSLLSKLNSTENRNAEIFERLVFCLKEKTKIGYNHLNTILSIKSLLTLIDFSPFNISDVFTTLKQNINTFVSDLLDEILKHAVKIHECLNTEDYKELSQNSKLFEIEDFAKKIKYRKLHSKLKFYFTVLTDFITTIQTNYNQNTDFLASDFPTIFMSFIHNYLLLFTDQELDLATFVSFKGIPDTFIHLHVEPLSKIIKFLQFVDYFNLENPRNRQFEEIQIQRGAIVLIYGLVPFLLKNLSNIPVYQNLIYNTIISLSSSDTILRPYLYEGVEYNIFTNHLNGNAFNLQMLVVETRIAWNVKSFISYRTLLNILKKFKFHINKTVREPMHRYKGRIEGYLHEQPFMLKRNTDLCVLNLETLHECLIEKQKELPRLHFTHILQLFASMHENFVEVPSERADKQVGYAELLRLMFICICDLNRRYKLDMMLCSMIHLFDKYRETLDKRNERIATGKDKANSNDIEPDYLERIYTVYSTQCIDQIIEKYESLFTSISLIFNVIMSYINENKPQNIKLPQIFNNLFLLIMEETLIRENFTYFLTKKIHKHTTHSLCIISICFLNIDSGSFEYIFKRLINSVMYLSPVTILFFSIFKKTVGSNIFVCEELGSVLMGELTKYLNTSIRVIITPNISIRNENTKENMPQDTTDNNVYDISYNRFILFLSQITASITSPFKTHTLLKKTISLLSQATAEH
ncbi:hypothetical protein CDIK_3964, partial [Cucumispora dikerogammari]